jgi:transposase InsO family protein
MVRKIAGPRAKSATALARETGIAQPTLSRWLREAGGVPDVDAREPEETPARRPQDWTLEEVLAAVLEASRLSGEELGAFLRRKGIHQAHLDEWRARIAAAVKEEAKFGVRSSDARRIQGLERELRRKGQALAEAAALLVLQDKSASSWGKGTRAPPRGATGDPGSRRRGRPGGRAPRARLRGRGDLRPYAPAVGAAGLRGGLPRGSPPPACRQTGVPGHKLSEAERRRIVATANAPEHEDLSPKQIVPRLAGPGVDRAPESSFYRLLRAENLLAHSDRSRPPPPRPKEPVATGPDEVWAWDITYMPAAVRGTFFYLHLVEDMGSRKIVGWSVEDAEPMEHGARLLEEAAKPRAWSETGWSCTRTTADP